jgi:hypothetical protein
VQSDNQQLTQLQTKSPITSLYEQFYLLILKVRLLPLLLPFSIKLGLIILEEKTHISETKIRISMITTILIVCLGLFSTDLSNLHVLKLGNNSFQSTSQNLVEISTPNAVNEEEVIKEEVVKKEVVKKEVVKKEVVKTENILHIQTIPESREEQILLFEQYQSYLQRNPGTPLIYLNASILAFSLNYDNLGKYYLDQAILLNPELKETIN